jgi:putative FmdB family regulatory protein
MPHYDYRCDDCEHEFEAFQSMRADPLGKCPECEKHALKRLIGSGSGILFKGTGFYQTDYKQAAPSDGEGSDSGGCGPADGG